MGPGPGRTSAETVAGFSGVGTYRTQVEVAEAVLDGAGEVLLVAEVGDVAQVLINGRDCGVLWTRALRARRRVGASARARTRSSSGWRMRG